MRRFVRSTTIGLAILTGSVAVASFTPLATASAQDGTEQSDQGRDGRRNARMRHIAKAAVKVSADTIGIPPQQLLSEVRSGKTSIAAVATAHGVDPQAVIDALVSAANTRIEQAVTDGKLPPERAAEIKAKVPEKAATFVNRVFDGSRRPDRAAS